MKTIPVYNNKEKAVNSKRILSQVQLSNWKINIVLFDILSSVFWYILTTIYNDLIKVKETLLT